jgi:hydrogenase expression/formation protein HypD
VTQLKYLDEYRDPALAQALAKRIRAVVTRPWTIMEVCGGQTHAIMRYGLQRLLPDKVELVHGPGCPVCVTSLEMIDRAHAIASEPDVIFASFGDMLRVPGSRGDLLSRRAQGADVRVVYSPLDALKIAEENPTRSVVFFAIGFETTAPANALCVHQAARRGLENFSVLVSHVLVPPVIAAILQSADNRVQALLGPGHVCSVVGYREYESLSTRYHVPIVVSGFEPLDLLAGVLRCVTQLEAGTAVVENQYARGVTRNGSAPAKALIDEVFEVTDRKWRGIGSIPKSGLRLRHEYRKHDAVRLFDVEDVVTSEPCECISGLVLRGQKKPHQCPAFAKTCTPESPLGATMVSSEGACRAYYVHARDSLVREGART